VQTALDLGTGSGYLAILATAHSGHVVATDVNPRALEVTRFNAALNDLSLEVLEGGCFTPVAGRTFDLIISNPPFIVSPGEQAVYRDSGLPLDQISEQIVREATAFLNQGGFAYILTNWVQRTGEDWRDHLGKWVQGSGCDAYVLHHDPAYDPAVYATTWVPEAEKGGEKFRERFTQWMKFFEQERIEKIHAGAFVLRKRDARNWFVCAPSAELVGTAGEAVLGEITRFDYLAATPDAQLLDAHFRISPLLAIHQTAVASENSLTCTAIVLKLREGLARTIPITDGILAIITRVHPDRTLGSILHELAELSEQPADTIIAGALPNLRELIFQGIILPELQA
jgi:hypothetical protein